MKPTHSALYVHWLGRIAALALAGLFLMFLFGESEGTINLANQPPRVQLIFLGWAFIFLGYVVGWFRPIVGGAMVLAALAGMNVVQWSESGTWLGPWFFLWGVPGVLFLIAGWLGTRPTRDPAYPASAA
jgi:hypothetical protein